jgi:type II restriction enzyme
LKSQKGWNPKKIPDAGYDAMLRAIAADRTPNLLILQYSSTWLVKNLLLIPRVFFTRSIIEKRSPLAPNARRAGWVGCNILLAEIPRDGKVAVVSDGVALPEARVRTEFSRVRKLAEVPPSMRGWTVDVLGLVRRLEKDQFTLHELYAFEDELKTLHPGNRNIRPKIRQQLQVLRDMALLEFVGEGRYVVPR